MANPYQRVPEREARCREMADIFLPVLRYVAESCGYAIAVHGSMKRDIDLVAVPWRDSAVRAESLVRSFREVVKAVTGLDSVTAWEKKPAGRRAVAIHLTHDYGNGPYLDISVAPIVDPNDLGEDEPTWSEQKPKRKDRP